jgi:hypothetical protein
MTTNVVVVRKDAPLTDLTAALRDCRVNASSPPARNLAAVLKKAHMYPYPALSVSPYPNSALSAGQYAIIAVGAVLALSAWLILVFAADREPRHRGTAAGTMSRPQQPRGQEREHEEPERKAA